MSTRMPIKPSKTFTHQSRFTSSTSIDCPHPPLPTQPDLTSFQDLLLSPPLSRKFLHSKDKTAVTSTSISSNKSLPPRPLSSIELMEKRQIWPSKRSQICIVNQACLTPKRLATSQSINEIDKIQQKRERNLPMNRYDKIIYQSKTKSHNTSTGSKNQASLFGYIPNYETKIPPTVYNVMTSYSSARQIPKKPSFKKTFEPLKQKESKKMVSVGVETELTMTELNAMENQFKNKRRQRHSATPEIDYTQEDKKVYPDVLNRKLERVLKKYQ